MGFTRDIQDFDPFVITESSVIEDDEITIKKKSKRNSKKGGRPRGRGTPGASNGHKITRSAKPTIERTSPNQGSDRPSVFPPTKSGF